MFIIYFFYLKLIILSDFRKRKIILYNITYVWNLDYDTDKFIYKPEIDLQTYKTDLWF